MLKLAAFLWNVIVGDLIVEVKVCPVVTLAVIAKYQENAALFEVVSDVEVGQRRGQVKDAL